MVVTIVQRKGLLSWFTIRPSPPPQLHASCLPSFRPRRVVYFVGVGGREDGGGLILKVFLALKTNTEIFEKHYTRNHI